MDKKHVWTTNTAAVFALDLEDYIGNYWCELIQYPFMSVSKSNSILAYRKETHEFSLDYVYQVTNPPCVFTQNCIDTFRADLFFNNDELLLQKGISKAIRIMEITAFDETHNLTLYIRAIVHISTDKEHNVISDYHRIYNSINHQATKSFRSSEYCLPEKSTLTWSLSEINTEVSPKEICVQENGKPVTRPCQGDFISGALWGEITGECSKDIDISDVTATLYNITLSKLGLNESRTVSTLSEKTSNLSSLDVHYFDHALRKMQEASKMQTADSATDIVKTVNNLMMVDKTILRNTQELYGSTDSILFTIETFYSDVRDFTSNASQNLLELKQNNLLAMLSKPLLNNISGIAIYGSSFQNLQTRNIRVTDNLTSFVNNDLQLLVRVPQSVLNSRTNGTVLDVTVFANDNLFIEQNSSTNLTVANFVVSVSITEYEGFLREPLEVWFRSDNYSEYNTCSFWDYSVPRNNHLPRKPGAWSDVGGQRTGVFQNLSTCAYSHLTPFTLLVSTTSKALLLNETTNGSSASYANSERNDLYYQNIITIVGSVLSVVSIVLIFLTAIVLKKFRQEAGTKILLQLSAVIFLELIMAQVADKEFLRNHAGWCQAEGVVLHYVLLCKFSWMLVFAFLQYRRFVDVLRPVPSRVVLKTSLFAWISPLCPVIISSMVDLSSYAASGLLNFCYPKGQVLIWGVLLPIGLIVFLNMCVFLAVMLNVLRVTHRFEPVEAPHKKIRAFCLSILLFFMLGVPWIFGLIGETFATPLFNYLFCILATLEGFILFLFYVVLNSDVRRQYCDLVCKKKLCKK